MERWHNRVAVVTGASSGIGAACCLYLVRNGMVVVGLARRKQRVDDLRNELQTDEEKQRLHAIKCDVQEEAEICAAFAEIEKNIGPIAVLINNAGIARDTELLTENNTEDLRAIIDTNVMGVALCTREAFRSIKKHGGDGHVVIINSIAGHKVANAPKLNIYPASKFAVTAMTETYRQEFLSQNTKCKITSISPGVVYTEIFSEAYREIIKNFPFLKADDIADAVIYCLQTPPHVQIHELTIKPVGEVLINGLALQRIDSMVIVSGN